MQKYIYFRNFAKTHSTLLMILVTGATGLVGGHLLWQLLQKNENIIALRRSSSNLKPLEAIFRYYSDEPGTFLNRIIWRFADLNSTESLEKAFENVKEVYHCAAVVSLGKGDDMLMKTNIEGTRNLLDICMKKQIEKLCFVSSIAACGHDKDNIVDENTPWNDGEGKGAYAISKYLAEQEVWKAIKNGLKAVIVNPGVILGPSGSDGSSSVIFTKMRNGMLFYPPGGSGYVDVRDVVKVMIALMEKSITAERFVLVAENRSTKDIITLICTGFDRMKPFIKISKGLMFTAGYLMEMLGNIFGFKPLIDRNMARSATNSALYSSGKIIKILNYSFIPVEDSIRDTCKFMIEEEQRNKS